MSTRAAIYCRLSEEDRNKHSSADDSNSIQNQKVMLLQYAAEHHWDVYQIYSDDDYTGADRRRPAFNRLLTDAQDRRFDIILCKTQSRFTRELELVEKYIHGLFPLWGIRFISIVDNADTDNRGNKKSRQINGLVNEWYLEDMSDNIRSVLTTRRKNGLHIGSFALYGYQKDPDRKGHLLIDEEAAAVVREVFTLFSQGYGKTAIARILNERQIPNPTEYKRLHGLHCRQPGQAAGTLWKYSTIADMLENELYIGNMVQGKYGSVSYKTKQNRPRPQSEWYRVENTHDPIIDRRLWDKVQALRAQKAKPFAAGTIGLFAGKARCHACGYVMRSTTTRGRRYLQCPNHHISENACPGAFISVDRLEQTVLHELLCLSEQYLEPDEVKSHPIPIIPKINCSSSANQSTKKPAAQEKAVPQQIQQQLSDIASLREKISECSHAVRSLYLDKTKGLFSECDFLNLLNEFTAEKKRLEQLAADAQRQLNALEKQHIDEEHTKKAASSKESQNPNPPPQHTTDDLSEPNLFPEHLTRQMVEALIDHILVGKRIPGTRDVPIEIYWNF